MTKPLAETEGEKFGRTDQRADSDLGHHVVHPEYDDLFELSWTPACEVVHDLFGDYELAVEIAETALLKIGTSWLYVPHDEEFVKALAVVFALSHFANAERAARWNALARERRQGRSLSSAHDVQFDVAQWLDEFLAACSAGQRRDLDAAVTPLTRQDLAVLLDEMNPLQVPRSTARRWRTRAPEET